jgi:hypothetical protein
MMLMDLVVRDNLSDWSETLRSRATPAGDVLTIQDLEYADVPRKVSVELNTVHCGSVYRIYPMNLS